MSRSTQQLRDRILTSTHVPIGVGGLLLKLVDIIQEQEEEIERLNLRLNATNVTMGNQYLRQEGQVTDLRKEIERLKGVHGA